MCNTTFSRCFCYHFQVIFPLLFAAALSSKDGVSQAPNISISMEDELSWWAPKNTTSDDGSPCKVIDKVFNCSQMNLTHNNLRFINIPNYEIFVITKVKLAHNKLDDVPGEFLEQFENVEEIYLDDNFMVLIPTAILTMDQLMVLSLQNNSIMLQRSLYFQQMAGLKKLNLKYNEIDELRNKVFTGLG